MQAGVELKQANEHDCDVIHKQIATDFAGAMQSADELRIVSGHSASLRAHAGEQSGKLTQALERSLGSPDKLRTRFRAAGAARFGDEVYAM